MEFLSLFSYRFPLCISDLLPVYKTIINKAHPICTYKSKCVGCLGALLTSLRHTVFFLQFSLVPQDNQGNQDNL